MRSFLLIAIFFLLAGCSSMDGPHLTSFIPTETPNTFIYTAKAPLNYAEDSKNAEEARLNWLKEWANDNNFRSYKVISRKIALQRKTFFGDVYNIYYTVKTK